MGATKYVKYSVIVEKSDSRDFSALIKIIPVPYLIMYTSVRALLNEIFIYASIIYLHCALLYIWDNYRQTSKGQG